MSCDLHTHSTFSDGTCTPEEIVSAAEALGLTAVALCDHNDVDGLPRFLRAAEGKRTAAGAAILVFPRLRGRAKREGFV